MSTALAFTCNDDDSDGDIQIGKTESECTTDGTNDEIEIQRAFDNASGKTIKFNSSDERFNVSDTLLLNVSNVNLTGTSSTKPELYYTIATPGTDSMLLCPHDYDVGQGSPPHPTDNVTFYKLKFTSATTWNTADHTLIETNGVDNLTFDDVDITSYTWGLIMVNGYQNILAASDDLTIKNCEFYEGGINFAYVTNVSVHDNIFDGLGSQRSSSIDCNRDNEDVWIYNNWISGDQSGNDPAVKLYSSTNQNFYNNTIVKGRHGIGLWANWISPTNIYDNNISGTFALSGISINSQSGPETGTDIYNNIINAPDVPGILFENVVGYGGRSNIVEVNITNNAIVNGTDGIKINDDYAYATMKNNIIVNQSGYGINNATAGGESVSTYNNVWNNTGGNYSGMSAGTGDISVNPLFRTPTDFHLQSVYGSWNGVAFVNDGSSSLCIDAGDIASDYSAELEDNGNRINIGAYGNTSEASKSGSWVPVQNTSYLNYTVKWWDNGTTETTAIEGTQEVPLWIGV